MRRIIVKEEPLVFIRDVLLMEVIAAVFFYAVSFITNYEQLFAHLGVTHFIRYNDLLVVGFSLFQLIYVTALFLYWYSSYYEVNEKEIIHATGSLFRHRKMVSIKSVVLVETTHSALFGRFMPNHATIVLEHANKRITKIRNVGNYSEYVEVIKHLVSGATGRSMESDAEYLIKHGEDKYTEFKETLRYDAKKGETSKELEHAVIKAIVGFLNADGGTLLIGVNDSGEVKGLENDYKALPKKNRDGFENHLSMLIKTMIGLPYAKYVGVRFERLENKDICIVQVQEAHKPAYVRNGDRREEFFVRVGNSTQPFTMSEAEEYIKNRWK